MNSGSRPIARMARTGEFTPPGRSVTARPYRAADFVSLRLEVATTVRSDACVLALPLTERVREVEHPDLLVLRRGVERGALVDPRLLGDRVEDRVALLLGAPVGHREQRVGPVGVRRALVAVGDPARGGHLATQLEDAVLGHGPDAHAVGGEAGAAVVEDRGDAAQALALLQRLEPAEDLLLLDAQALGGGRERLGDDRHRALRGLDDVDVLQAVLDRLELERLRGLD